jgi:hypothetical protein
VVKILGEVMIEFAMSLFEVSVGFNRQMLRPASWKLYWWVLGRWAVLVAAICWILGVLSLIFGLSSELYWVLMVLGLVVVGEAFLFPYWQGRAKPNPLNQGDFHFVADEQGLQVDGPFGTQTIKWSAYSGVLRDDRFLYLMISRRRVQIVPLFGGSDPTRLLDYLESIGLRPRRFNMLTL